MQNFRHYLNFGIIPLWINLENYLCTNLFQIFTKMKSLNTILIIVLSIAIGVLYFLHFTKNSKSPVKTETEPQQLHQQLLMLP